MVHSTRLLIGWREWISLPDLKIPVIKAKVDTGARTSSLHAFEIESYYERGVLKVRFFVHPLQRRKDIVIKCDAPVVDYRVVSDSGGHREKRFVIETNMVMGGVEFTAEVTLANRETMSHRMLLGRAAMKDMVIDPGSSYLLGEPPKKASAYRGYSPRKLKRVGR